MFEEKFPPIVFENVLSPKTFSLLNQDLLRNLEWGNRADMGTIQFWGGIDRNTPFLYDIASTIKLKIKKTLKKEIYILRSHLNGQTRGQEGVFHVDSRLDGVYTFVLFTNMSWSANWGGEFVHFDGEAYNYVNYVPNRGVLFKSNDEHKGNAPNTITDELRTSAAFMYAEPNVFEEARESLKFKGQVF